MEARCRYATPHGMRLKVSVFISGTNKTSPKPWLTVEGPRFDERIGRGDASLRPGTVVKHKRDAGAYQK
jgi:hypothetical protein